MKQKANWPSRWREWGGRRTIDVDIRMSYYEDFTETDGSDGRYHSPAWCCCHDCTSDVLNRRRVRKPAYNTDDRRHMALCPPPKWNIEVMEEWL